MSDVFVLRNQHGAYLNKQREWIAFGDTKTLFRSDQRDELVNEKVELTVKAPDLRVRIIAANLESNGRVFVDGEECLPRTDPNESQTEQLDLGSGLEQKAAAAESDILAERAPENIQNTEREASSDTTLPLNTEGEEHVLNQISS